ncbi:MAG: pilus assembly protein PilP [Bradymonadaceae bacterium]|nr:pilus assembly protein PilP [Lujinxingiaceae bacterium]
MTLAGCGLFDDEPSQAPPPPLVQAAPPVPVVTQPKGVAEYQRPEYSGRRRNPFQPEADVFQPASTTVVGEVRPLEPLEEFAISQLTLVALISETAVPMVMFVDGDGLGHVVKEGDRVGRNGGIITNIRDNEVEIREGAEDDSPYGGTVITLKLRDLDISGEEEGLSSQDREALERLLQTEQGRQALEQYRDSPRAEENAPEPSRATADPRFQGTAPPRQ